MRESQVTNGDDERRKPTGDPTVRTHAALLEEYLGTSPDTIVHTLRLLAAVDEVIAVCESVRGGRQAPEAHDGRTLRDDVQRALTGLGKELRRALEPTWHDYYHGEMAAIPELLRDAGGVLRLLNATRVLRDRVRRPASSQAAWGDLLASVRGGNDAEEVVRLHALQLREIEEALGHEALPRGSPARAHPRRRVRRRQGDAVVAAAAVGAGGLVHLR